MTNLEAIKAKIGLNYPIDDETFDVAIAESGLDPNAEFTGGYKFDVSMIGLLVTLIASAERISEGGYTVQLNLDALQRLLSWLLAKWNLPDPTRPMVNGAPTNKW